MAAAAAPRARRAAHELSRAAGGGARRVLRGPDGCFRDLAVRPVWGRDAARQRPADPADAERRGGNRGGPRLRPGGEPRTGDAGARRPARRQPVAVSERRGDCHERAGARRAGARGPVPRAARVRTARLRRRAGPERRRAHGREADPRRLPRGAGGAAARASDPRRAAPARGRTGATAPGGPGARRPARDAGGPRRRGDPCRPGGARFGSPGSRAAGGGRRRGARCAASGVPARGPPRVRARDVGVRAYGGGRAHQPSRAGGGAPADRPGARKRGDRRHRRG